MIFNGDKEMGDERDEVVRAASVLGVKFLELPQNMVEEILNKIENNYTKNKNSIFMWEDISGGLSIQNEDAWQWIDKIVGNA
jgi:hypothetical protein